MYIPEGAVAQETAKRKLEVEMKEEIEVHHIIVIAVLRIDRDLVAGTK